MDLIYCQVCAKIIQDENGAVAPKLLCTNGSTIHTCISITREEYLKIKPNTSVNHPGHYGGESNPYETIKVIAAWKLGFCLGNVIKYISRAGKKDPEKYIEDLEKAKFYLEYKINELKKEQNKS